MQLVGESVDHSVFGEGIIVELNNDTIEVQFINSKKKFPYPSVFNGFLVLHNKHLQDEIQKLINIENEKKRLANIKEQQDKEHNSNLIKQYSIMSTVRQQQNRDKCGIAIKCNFCNGGKAQESFGFQGVCSDDMIRMNIHKLKRKWCSSDDSSCKKYTFGLISRKELDDIYTQGGFVCYESRIFRDWIASAGRYQSEHKHDEPMKMNSVRPNRLCILTTLSPHASESERIIFAAFIIKSVENGKDKEESSVTAHDVYRIQLTTEEAEKLPFWKYYMNKSESNLPAWRSGLFRYLTDMQSAQILQDIAKIKTDPKLKMLADNMLQYFCQKNSIDISCIEDPTGAIF